MTKSSDSQQKREPAELWTFAVSGDHRVKIKESEK